MQDNLNREFIYVIIFFSIAVIVIDRIAFSMHVRKNWDRMRCRPEVMKSMWLYGIDANDNMEYCLENAGKQIIKTNHVSPMQMRIGDVRSDLNDKMKILDASYAELDKKVNNADLYKNKQNTNLAIAIQNNVLAVKEGMQKIIASLIIQKHMNNGILKVTNNNRMLNDSIRESINKIK